MGMTRDDVPFDEALYGDIVYTIDDDTLPEYSRNNNDHYQDGSEDGKEFFEKLVRRKQSEVSGLSPQVASGLFTTRGFAAAYYVAGTNRAALRFSMMNFMCRDMEQLSDISRHDYRVRQDVDRAPGGDPATYKSKCVGCHAGMDALAGAFAYMDFDDDGRFIYNPLRPRSKFTVNNNTFKDGFVTEDNTWINLWVDGPNSVLGWRGAATGKGVKSYGSMLAATEQFSSCMAEQALKVTCRPDENDPNYKTAVKHLAQNFEQGGYNLKHLFVKSALTCRGE
jgi:hypothetical protein